MTNIKEIYADGIDQIHYSGGMVRLDLFSLQPAPQNSEQGQPPVSATSTRIIMTPQGFLASFSAMQHLADKLVEAGVLQKRHDQTAK